MADKKGILSFNKIASIEGDLEAAAIATGVGVGTVAVSAIIGAGIGKGFGAIGGLATTFMGLKFDNWLLTLAGLGFFASAGYRIVTSQSLKGVDENPDEKGYKFRFDQKVDRAKNTAIAFYENFLPTKASLMGHEIQGSQQISGIGQLGNANAYACHFVDNFQHQKQYVENLSGTTPTSDLHFAYSVL